MNLKYFIGVHLAHYEKVITFIRNIIIYLNYNTVTHANQLILYLYKTKLVLLLCSLKVLLVHKFLRATINLSLASHTCNIILIALRDRR